MQHRTRGPVPTVKVVGLCNTTGARPGPIPSAVSGSWPCGFGALGWHPAAGLDHWVIHRYGVFFWGRVVGLPCQWDRTRRAPEPRRPRWIPRLQLWLGSSTLKMCRNGLYRSARAQRPQFTRPANLPIVAPQYCPCLHVRNLRWRAPPLPTPDVYREFQFGEDYLALVDSLADLDKMQALSEAKGKTTSAWPLLYPPLTQGT